MHKWKYGGKAIKKGSGASLGTLKDSATFPTRNMFQLKVSKPSHLGFILCSKTLFDKEEDFPNTRMKEGFNLNAYKLMEQAGYDFNNPVVLGKLVDVKTYNLNKMPKKI